jgi:hypothetical protein
VHRLSETTGGRERERGGYSQQTDNIDRWTVWIDGTLKKMILKIDR